MIADHHVTLLSDYLANYLELCANVMTAITTVMIAVTTSLGDNY